MAELSVVGRSRGRRKLFRRGPQGASRARRPGQSRRLRAVEAGRQVYTAIVPTAHTDSLLPIIRQHVQPDSIVYTDAFRAYNALAVNDFHHLRINHSSRFADHDKHINGIESFWNQAKRHLRKFNGINPENFYWFLKECEWRFNGANHHALLKQLRAWYKHAHH